MSLYNDLIVQHDRHPHHEGPLAGETHHATLDNPMCGDVVTMHFHVDTQVSSATFEARGCSLSRAAASMLSDLAPGKSPDEIKQLAVKVEAFIMSAPDAPVPSDLGELEAFANVRAFKSRRTCVTLAFRAAVQALK
ncbi:MAG: SUF system NifU family Fe-S cluster assembly protein [Kofleriaceae bacterium]